MLLTGVKVSYSSLESLPESIRVRLGSDYMRLVQTRDLQNSVLLASHDRYHNFSNHFVYIPVFYSEMLSCVREIILYSKLMMLIVNKCPALYALGTS